VEPKGQAIERYLRSGDYEHDHPEWPGQNISRRPSGARRSRSCAGDRQAEATERIATMKVGGAGVTSADLLRYSDAIDWTRQDDAKTLGALARVLLRVVAGLASELESFRRAHG
jgi:hypothetical protein